MAVTGRSRRVAAPTPVELAEAKVAVGDELAHVARLGKDTRTRR